MYIYVYARIDEELYDEDDGSSSSSAMETPIEDTGDVQFSLVHVKKSDTEKEKDSSFGKPGMYIKMYMYVSIYVFICR
jgi:hypothetical protein